MIGLSSATDWRLLVATLVGLFLFGLVFNYAVGRMGARKDGYTSLFVVGGVLVTLCGVALISWQAAGVCLMAFAASGLPMVIGDVQRAIERREEALEQLRQAATDRKDG